MHDPLHYFNIISTIIFLIISKFINLLLFFLSDLYCLHVVYDIFQIKFPVQYEDFFITQMGNIVSRPAYHDPSHIWPIGYRSIWHDKITGSIFECVVSDGGASGAVFSVRRSPCSVEAVPSGKTILLSAKSHQLDPLIMPVSDDVIVDSGFPEDDQISMLLSDVQCPAEDLFSCFPNGSNESCNTTFMNKDTHNLDPLLSQVISAPGPNISPIQNINVKDEIGVFSVEGDSSSSVWQMVSQTFINTCKIIYKQSHNLHFFCTHRDQVNGIPALHSDTSEKKRVDNLGSLSRFCCAAGPINISHAIKSESDFEAACESLSRWLDQDRFGLDMDFSQEIIEQLPGAETCKEYTFLRDRTHHPNSYTVTSGLLIAKHGNAIYGEKEFIPRDSYLGLKSSCLPNQHTVDDHSLPLGRTFQSRLPAELLGDVLQVSINKSICVT